MKKIFTLTEAAEWLSRHSDFDVAERDVLLANAEGKLPICFRCRGELGWFENHPETIEHVYFDGYLRGLDSRCHLDTPSWQIKFKKTPEGVESIRVPKPVKHVFCPHRVEAAITLAVCPKREIEASKNGFWGLVNPHERVHDRPDVRILYWTYIPRGNWAFHIDDLNGYLSGEQAQREAGTGDNGAGGRIILMHEPKKKDEWFDALRDCIGAFEQEKGYTPNETQLWVRLKTNPPEDYGIEWGARRKELIMGCDETLDRENFGRRYRRLYPPDNNADNGQ
jgi:hypothetical protein